MKHLLNNLSEEEKNKIREQHTGGKKLVIENFDKLLNTKQGDARPYLSEDEDKKEPTCKSGEYFLGEKKMTEQDVMSYMSKHQESFNGVKCIGGVKKQVNCRKGKDGKLDCQEPTGY